MIIFFYTHACIITIVIIRQPKYPVVGRRPQHAVSNNIISLYCAVLCQIVSLQYLSRSSLWMSIDLYDIIALSNNYLESYDEK